MSKIVTFSLRREEIILDMQNIAYVIARANTASTEGPSSPDIAWLMDVAQKLENGGDNNEIATRCINLSWAEAQYKLSAWSKRAWHYEALDNQYTEHDIYKVELHVPNTMSKAAVTLMSELLHNFVVYKSLCCWADIIGADTKMLTDKVTEFSDKLWSVITNEGAVKIRPMAPFDSGW